MVTRLCALLFCIVVVTSGVVAQETSIAPKAKALLFSFNGLDALGANEFNGGLGVKYYLASDMAIRIGIEFASANQTIAANPPAGTPSSDGSVSGTRFGVSGALEYHLTRSRVSPYIGAGVGLSSTSTETKSVVVGTGTQTVVKNDVGGETIGGRNFTAGLTLSIGALAGVEVFIMKEVSLSAEYQVGFESSSRSDQEVTTGATTTKTKVGGTTGIGIRTAGFLTLAVYF